MTNACRAIVRSAVILTGLYAWIYVALRLAGTL